MVFCQIKYKQGYKQTKNDSKLVAGQMMIDAKMRYWDSTLAYYTIGTVEETDGANPTIHDRQWLSE